MKYFKKIFVLCLVLVSLPNPTKLKADEPLKPQKLLEIVQKQFPEQYATEMPKWFRLRDSCAEQVKLEKQYLLYKKEMKKHWYWPFGSKEKGGMKIYFTDLTQRSIITAHNNIEKSKLDHIDLLHQNFWPIKYWSQHEGLLPYWDQIEKADQKLESYLENGDFQSCANFLDKFLPERTEKNQ